MRRVPRRVRRWKITTKSILVLLSLLAPLLLLPAGHASSVLPGNGSFVQTGVTSITTSQAGNALIIKETFGLAFTGAFTGTTVGTVTIIINTSTGTGTFSGENSFTGTVTTSGGTASGTVQAPFSATFVGNNFHGEYSLFGGTGGLTNLAGQGTIQGALSPSFTGTYSGFFTPN